MRRFDHAGAAARWPVVNWSIKVHFGWRLSRSLQSARVMRILSEVFVHRPMAEARLG
jgi:hypothetical protein